MFLIKTKHLLEKCVNESKVILATVDNINVTFSKISDQELDDRISESENSSTSIIFHDPGKRKKIQTDNERDSMLSLGPFQPKCIHFPKRMVGGSMQNGT